MSDCLMEWVAIAAEVRNKPRTIDQASLLAILTGCEQEVKEFFFPLRCLELSIETAKEYHVRHGSEGEDPMSTAQVIEEAERVVGSLRRALEAISEGWPQPTPEHDVFAEPPKAVGAAANRGEEGL